MVQIVPKTYSSHSVNGDWKVRGGEAEVESARVEVGLVGTECNFLYSTIAFIKSP